LKRRHSQSFHTVIYILYGYVHTAHHHVEYILTEDSSGQSSSCDFNVTIVDDKEPEITCNPDLNISTLPGDCEVKVDLIPPVITDNCSGGAYTIKYIVFNPDNTTSGELTDLTYDFDVGTSRIQWIIEDDSGNSDVCFQNVIVTANAVGLTVNAGVDATICETDSYQLLAISSQKTWQNLTFKLAITNLLDEYYQQPLGGVSIANYKQDISNGFEQLAGQGRSYNASVSYQF